MPADVEGRRGAGLGCPPVVDVPTLAGPTPSPAGGSSTSSYDAAGGSHSPIVQGGAPGHGAYSVNCVLAVGRQLRARGISGAGAEILLASWEPGTARQYSPHLKRRSQFCVRGDINSLAPSLSDVINFLSDTFHRDLGYEAVNTAWSALSSLGIVLDGCWAGNHPLVIRFMKGVFHLRSPRPRYTATWAVQPVLLLLKSIYPLHTLSLKEITLKLVMLMALTHAARVQTLHLLILSGISFAGSSITLRLRGPLRQARPGCNVCEVWFRAYDQDVTLCVCTTLRHYLQRTASLRLGLLNGNDNLLLSFIRPHKPVGEDSLAHWIKMILSKSGVDTSKFTAGSVRSAEASKAKAMAVHIVSILATAGWSNVSTFARFYDKASP